jgi:hypothetical protein
MHEKARNLIICRMLPSLFAKGKGNGRVKKTRAGKR